jgi:hypothetical protein
VSDDIHIDRLVLDLPGLSLAEARAIAQEVGEGLLAARAGSYETLSASVEARTGEPAGTLASRIVAQLLLGLR